MNLFENAEDLYKGVLSEILANGNEVAPRGMKTRELLHTSVTLANPRANVIANRARKVSQTYAVAELLWILTGRRDVKTLAAWNPNVEKYSDDGQHFFGAYGPWVRAQLPYVVKVLKDDPDSRQAVITLWQQSPPKTKDVPCTVSFQYLLRRGRLHAQTFMRSNDAWLGLPYDLFTFTGLQQVVAAALGAELGRYTHTVGSLHLYEQDWQKAKEAVACPTRAHESPRVGIAGIPGLVNLNDLNGAFESLSTLPAAPVDRTWIEQWPEPWRTWLGLLAYRSAKAPALLRAPYDQIIGAAA